MEPSVSGPSGHSSSTNACLACRKIKMKCILPQDSANCERCKRKSIDCVFHNHRRGRKLGTRLSLRTGRRPRVARDEQDRTAAAEVPAQSMPISRNDDTRPQRATNSHQFWTNSEGFQPPRDEGMEACADQESDDFDESLLNKQARGHFSLQNVLSTSAGEIHAACAKDSHDPVYRGLVNDAIARSLFEGFMSNLNPFICQFDRELHTFEYVREKSPFLFVSLLAAAAKALNPALHLSLRSHAEKLFSCALRHGDKSPEVVQAILALTYWKEADDTRAFVNVGVAMRIAMELGWHRIGIQVRTPSANHDRDDRSRRNAERTWLVLFVYDRSISMQTGTPWMIQRSQFIESASDWLSAPMATSTDPLLCAFVSLRLLTSDIPELLSPHNGHYSRDHSHHTRPLVKAMKDQLERWQRQWTRMATQERCHPFLTEFYGNHTLLMLFSLPLQSSLSGESTPVDMESLWISYSAALKMLQLVGDDNNRSHLYFAQDSIHVMIAYAAVFLVKLLLSVPISLRNELEVPLLDSLSTASNVFSQQAAPPTSSSALQSVFLTNVVAMAREQSRHRGATNTVNNRNRSRPNPQPLALEADIRSSGHVESAPGPVNANTAESADVAYQNQGIIEQDHDIPLTAQSQAMNFFDEEMWSTVFANAGFSISDGIFLPGDNDC